MNPINPSDRQISTNLEEHNIMINKINEIVGSMTGVENSVISLTASVTTMGQTVHICEENVTALLDRVSAFFKNLNLSVNQSTITLTLTRDDDTTLVIPFPVASTTSAGIMNSAQASAIESYANRISALENVGTTYILTLPSTTPTQTEITNAYHTTYPSAPVIPLNGCYVYDPSKPLRYTYDANTSTWIRTAEAGTSQWTNTNFGIAKGSSTGEGKIYAESDGTGSVIGWDVLTTKVTNALSKIKIRQATTGGKETIIESEKDGVDSDSLIIKNVMDSTADPNENCLITKSQYAGLIRASEGNSDTPDYLKLKYVSRYIVPNDAMVEPMIEVNCAGIQRFSITRNGVTKNFIRIAMKEYETNIIPILVLGGIVPRAYIDSNSTKNVRPYPFLEIVPVNNNFSDEEVYLQSGGPGKYNFYNSSNNNNLDVFEIEKRGSFSNNRRMYCVTSCSWIESYVNKPLQVYKNVTNSSAFSQNYQDVKAFGGYNSRHVDIATLSNTPVSADDEFIGASIVIFADHLPIYN